MLYCSSVATTKEKETGKKDTYFWYVEFKYSSRYIVALLLRERKRKLERILYFWYGEFKFSSRYIVSVATTKEKETVKKRLIFLVRGI
jgi:hypothetical protein